MDFKMKKLFFIGLMLSVTCWSAQAEPASPNIAVGSQYDSTHIYVATQDLDKFVNSFVATFGGQPSKVTTTNVLPVLSSTQFRYIMSPVGMLSVFAYQTPIPYPFGQERYGYLVADMDQAINAAKQLGAEVIVAPFKDAIGRDVVIQWDGGVKMQLYWHFTKPNYQPLQTIPDNRVYISPDRANQFISHFTQFANGKIVEDNAQADAGEIGTPHQTYRKVVIESAFGRMVVLVTNGHLPYPFGYDITGFEVSDLNQTLSKAKSAGAEVLYGPYTDNGKITAILQFPGNFIAEVHSKSQ